MLEITVSADKTRNDGLCRQIFGRDCAVGVPFVLLVDGKDAGVMEAKLPPFGSAILSVGILPGCRGLGYGDFFTRAILSRLSELAADIKIGYSSDYYLRFGFRQRGEQMEIASKDLVFPHDCCGAH